MQKTSGPKFDASELATMILDDAVLNLKKDPDGLHTRILKLISDFGDAKYRQGSDYGHENERRSAQSRAAEHSPRSG